MADPLVLALAAAVAVQAIVLAVIVMALQRHRHMEEPQGAEKPAAPTTPAPAPEGNIEDVFLMHRSGLLLKHYTRRLRPNMDSDVLGGMLVAVQEFIKDSFRGEAGPLEIRFGDRKIKVLEGKWTIVAALVRGEATEGHLNQMKAALRDIEARYEDLLIDWDGTMDRIPEVDKIMQRLVEGGYRTPIPMTAA